MPRTTNPIHRTTSGRYQVRTRDADGRQLARTFATHREANAFLAAVRTDVRRGVYIDPADSKITFAAFAEQWAAGRDWKGTSRDTFPRVLRRLLPHLGELPLSAIDDVRLAACQAALRQLYAFNTTRDTMSYARRIMRAAFTSGRVARDSTIGLAPLRRRADERDSIVNADDVPTRAEALALLAAAPLAYRATVALGLTGLRVGEVLGITADRLDLEHRRLTIDRQLQRVGGENVLTTPKAEKPRTIVLPAITVMELRRHLRDHQGGGLLFRGARGAPHLRRDQFYRTVWAPTLTAAGMPGRFVFHSTRHFCASSMLAEGAPITAVAGHLGDTVETVQRVYAHWLRDDREIPAAVLDRIFHVEPAAVIGGIER